MHNNANSCFCLSRTYHAYHIMPVTLKRLAQFSLQLYKEATSPVFKRGSCWWVGQGRSGVLPGSHSYPSASACPEAQFHLLRHGQPVHEAGQLLSCFQFPGLILGIVSTHLDWAGEA